MLAKRLALLSAFAGGCASSVALLGLWRVSGASLFAAGKTNGAESAERGARVHDGVMPSARVDAAAPPVTAEPPREVRADAPRGAQDATSVPQNATSAPSAAAAPSDAEPAPEAGRSVAEVLAGLEAAYRDGLAATRNSEGAAVASLPAAAPVRGVSDAPRTPVDAPVGVTPTLNAAAPTRVAAVEAPASIAGRGEGNGAGSSAADAALARAGVSAAPASEVHIGDVHDNGYVGSVHQGDVYQVQRVEVLEYVPFYLPAAAAVAAGANGAYGATTGGTSASVATTRGSSTYVSTGGAYAVTSFGGPTYPGTSSGSQPFSLPLTNPDNPWGYAFRPPVLVK